MKKLLLFLLISVAFSSQAQRLTPVYTHFPVYSIPEKQEYGNYKTYQLYVYYEEVKPEYQLDGFYSLPSYISSLKQDTINGDFKIIVNVETFNVAKVFTSNDTLFGSPATITLSAKVFDKSGKIIFSKRGLVQDAQAVVLGVKTNSGVHKSVIAKSLVSNSLSYVLYDFINSNIIFTEYRDSYKPTTLWAIPYSLSFSEEKNKIMSEFSDSIDAIKAITDPQLYVQRAVGQIDFWKKQAELPDEKDNRTYRECGIHNLNLIYYISGNIEKSNEYAAIEDKMPGSTLGYIKKDVIKFKEKCSPQKFQYPVLKGPFIHSDDFLSAFSMTDAINQTRYFIIKGSIYMKDQSVIEGTCCIKRSIGSSREGQIANLSANEYEVTITKTDGTEIKTVLSKLESIKTEKSIYLCDKWNIKMSLYKSDKISLYQVCFPEQGTYYYQRNNSKLDSPSLFSSNTGWLKKYFKDCSELSDKIDKKEITDPIDMVKYYNEKCN